MTVFGDPHLCVIAFGTSCSHLLLADFLNYERGWSVAPIHKPDGLHLSLTLANYENIKNNLFDDVNDGIRYLEENSKNNKESAATALYGANTKIPTGFLQSEVLKCCIRASLK